MMLDYSLEHRSKQLAGNTYANLQNHLEPVITAAPVPIVVPSPVLTTSSSINQVPVTPAKTVSATGAVPFRDSTNLSGNYGIKTPKKSQGGPSVSFFSEKVAAGPPARTLTIYVKALDSTNKPQIDQQLLTLSGVVSFIVDTQRKRVTVRTTRTEEDVLECLKETRLKCVVVPANLEGDPAEDQENDPGYLSEPESENGNGWFSSLVSWGSTTVDERKETQRRNEQKKTYMSSRLMGHLFSIGESLWQ